MNGLGATAAAIVPWVAILGFFGLILRVRVSGDPVLWKRVEALEGKLENQRLHFEGLMAEERKDCATKLEKLEGRIRQLQQQQASFGHVNGNDPLGGALQTAYPVSTRPDRDKDLLDRLDKPRRRRK